MNYFQRQLISHKKADEQKTWLSCCNSRGENNQQVHGGPLGRLPGLRQGRLWQAEAR